MVYTGKPSGGCGTCRKRRIKCDEAKPSCSYCTKKNVTCPGYKSQFDVAWRDQNIVAEKAVLRRRKRDEKSPNGPPKQWNDRSQTELITSSAALHLQALSQNFDGYALDFFFSSYLFIQQDATTYRGFLECLNPIWNGVNRQSPLIPAVTAVAALLLEAWSTIKPDQPGSLSRSQYSRGVVALRGNLQKTGKVEDDILLAALMLDMYEMIRSFCLGESVKSPHLAGTRALVLQRKNLPLVNNTSQMVLLGARHVIVERAIMTSELVPEDVCKWTDLQVSTKSVAHHLDDLAIEVARLQVLALPVRTDDILDDQLIIDIVRQSLKLDQRLLVWNNTLPDKWIPIRVSGLECIPQSVRKAGLYQSHCDVYNSVFFADNMNTYYCLRIRLHRIIQACYERIGGIRLQSVSTTSLMTIQEMTDNICATVPYYLGDRLATARIGDKNVTYPRIAGLSTPSEHVAAAAGFGGCFLAPRLGELMSMNLPLRYGQLQWMGGQLHRIKKIYMVQPK